MVDLSSFSEAAGRAARNALCAYLENNENALAYAATLGLPTGTLGSVASGWRRGICSNPEPVIAPQPVPGGQCSGTYYQVDVVAKCENTFADVTYTAQYSSSFQPNQDSAIGPVSSGFVPFPTVGGLPFGLFGPPLNGLDGSLDGVYSLQAVSNDLPDNGILQQANNRILSASIVAITPISGPDNCGDTQPVPPAPFFPPTLPGNITYVDNNDTEITEEGDFRIFAPITNFNGELSFPIEIDVGGIELEFEFGGDGEGGLTDNSFPPVGDSLATPPPAESDPPDDPPSDRPIIAVVVTTTSIDAATASKIYQEGLPTLYVPRLATVQFQIQAGQNRAWTTDVPVKTMNAYIPCPEHRGAIDVEVSPGPGVTLTYSKVYARPPTEST